MGIETTVKCDLCEKKSEAYDGWFVAAAPPQHSAVFMAHQFSPAVDIPMRRGTMLICGPKCLAEAVRKWAASRPVLRASAAAA